MPSEHSSYTFASRLNGSNAPIGTWLMSGSASTAEALGYAGFDWLLVDMEHVPIEYRDLWHLLQAIQCGGAQPIVRVAANDPVLLKRALDLGSFNVMVPFVENAAQAQAAVNAVKYPPFGTRGFAAVHRASRYGTWADYGKEANDAVTCILQIETPNALANLEEIAAIPGVDALFLGPGDLSAACGHIGNPGHPQVQMMISDAIARAKKIGMPMGIVGGTPELVQSYLEQGYAFAAVASDIAMMMKKANEFLTTLKAHQAPAAVATPY
ncbi:HpcH/HpaI aldolase family protein [Serratia sp. UGAL515B_01]|uniref:HpcH/HpaI aldolase family protein n=1 Tax=Serratia sp. UGAL515B_01 TaxID=2986763 RepID=UPI002952D3EC|nr:aldolase/citrate lyase family protein [Serratia sp. UGAL515B_01]WON77738.1 aldolase/citrate lyase family protein [Serratia sp. UGAL515B_01]